MYCVNCGENLRDDAKFCLNCGAKIQPLANPDEIIKNEEPLPDNKPSIEEVVEIEPVVEEVVLPQETIETVVLEEAQGQVELHEPVEVSEPVEPPVPVEPQAPVEPPVSFEPKVAPVESQQVTYVAPPVDNKKAKKEKKNKNKKKNKSQNNNKPPKKKKRLGCLLIILIPFILIIALLVVSYMSLFAGVGSLDKHIEDVERGWSVYDLLNIDGSSGDITIEVDLKELNGYMNQRAVLKKIESGDFDVKTIVFDTKKDALILQGKQSFGDQVQVSGDYSISIKGEELIIDFESDSIGSDLPLVSDIALSSLFTVDTITVPLLVEDADPLITQLQTMEPDVSIDDDMMVIMYVLEAQYNNGADMITASESDQYDEMVDGDIKYVTISPKDMVSRYLSRVTTSGEAVLDGDLYTSDNNEILYRSVDDAGLKRDYILILDYDLGLDSLLVKEAKLYTDPDKSDDNLADMLNGHFEKVALGISDLYGVESSQVDKDAFRFYYSQTSWTVMVYLNGSDLESYEYDDGLSGMGTLDLDEMMAGLTNDSVNVVVETGGTWEWVNPQIDESQNQRWLVEPGNLLHLEDVGMENMCDPDTLESFVDFAMTNYPAEHYALIFWNHGAGSIYGFGYDEYFPEDYLTLDEMDMALSNVTGKHDTTLDVVGFDACLMATLDTAYILSDYADYLISSEETEPDYGWDYEHILQALTTGAITDGESFGEVVVEGFREDSVDKDMADLLTLSVVELSIIPKVVDSFDQLIDQLASDAYGEEILVQLLPDILDFGGNTESSGYTDHYDLEHFAKNLLEYYPNEANELIEALDDAVRYKFSGYLAKEAGGLSFYIPFYDLYTEYDILGMYEQVAVSETYIDFVSGFYDYRDSNYIQESDLSYTFNYETDPYTVSITPEAFNVLDWVYLNVYEIYYENDDYLYLDLGYDAWIAYSEIDDYTFEDSFGSWASIDGQMMPLWVIYENDLYLEYETPIYHNGEMAMMITAYRYDEEDYVVYGARPFNEDETGVVDRNIKEFMPGDEIIMLYDMYDDYGGVEVYESNPIIIGSEGIPIIKEIEFESGYEYGLQFVLVDIYGNITYTDYTQFSLN